jgi:hypothetical protein
MSSINARKGEGKGKENFNPIILSFLKELAKSQSDITKHCA